jgi:hypothetical protein
MPAQLEGELEVQHWDYPNKTGKYKHYLRTADGKRYELKFKGKVPQHQTGTKLRVKGAKSGNVLYLDSTSSGSIQVLAQAAVPNSLGEQRTLVILVNFQDQPTNKPWTIDQVKSFVFGPVSDFFKENSYQNTWLAGDVYGWYTIPMSSTSSTTCDLTLIANSAKQAATAAGANLSAYTRYIYMFPNTPACGWAGAAYVGGTPSEAYINGNLSVKTIGHEMGHAFGLYHSHSWACSDGSIIGTGSSCTTVNYGDGLDIMGFAPSGHFHAFQKERLGWLNNGVMPPITTVQTSGTYVIDPYETTGTKPKALKIFKGIDSFGFKTWYYLEYRQAVGFDNFLSTAGQPGGVDLNASNVLNGVLIHTGYEGNDGNTNYLLDMTPATYELSPRDPALVVGQSFTDPVAGVTITTRWVNSTNAAVDVTFNNQTSSTCTHAAPSVVLSSPTGSSVAAGSAVGYTVAVTNNDSSACAASSFNLQSSVPSGWSGSLGSSALTISPGSASSTTFTVTSPSTAPAGSYTVGATATNSTSTAFSGSGSASYSIVSTPTSTSLTTSVATDKASYRKGNTVTITGIVTSGSTAVANASVTFTVTKPNGTVVTQTATTGSNGQAVYKLKVTQKDSIGTYQVRDVASSNGSSANASTTFLVQ